LILTGALASAALASNWISFFHTTDESSDYDTKTMTFRHLDNGDYCHIWVRTIKSKTGESVMDHVDIHQETRRMRILSDAHYDVSGNVTRSSDTPTKWVDIAPDTKADDLYNVVFPSNQ
jgi:hypothetical protein